MLVTDATPSPYDIRFFLWGYPVRIAPWFWLLIGFLGWNLSDNDIVKLLTFMGCAAASLLLHEFGHGWSARIAGCQPVEIALVSLGGYCRYVPLSPLSRWQRVAISACGPLMNFLIAAICFPIVFGLVLNNAGQEESLLIWALGILFTINIVWGIFNLIPIWPMDGGQIFREFLTWLSPRKGAEWIHIISIGIAAVLAALIVGSDPRGYGLTLLILALLIFDNWQMYQIVRGGYQFHQDN